jgi:hypothetical protein
MMNHVGPEIPNHAKDVIQSELNKRKDEEMAIAADDVRNEGIGPSNLGKQDFNSVSEFEDFSDAGPDVEPMDIPTEPVETAPINNAVNEIEEFTSEQPSSADPDLVNEVKKTNGLSEEEAKAIIVATLELSVKIEEAIAARKMYERLIGIIVLEAHLLAEATKRLESIIRDSNKIRILSTETTEKLLFHLWKEYDAVERKEYLEPIFQEDEQTVLSIVKELAKDAGLGVEDR